MHQIIKKTKKKNFFFFGYYSVAILRKCNEVCHTDSSSFITLYETTKKNKKKKNNKKKKINLNQKKVCLVLISITNFLSIYWETVRLEWQDNLHLKICFVVILLAWVYLIQFLSGCSFKIDCSCTHNDIKLFLYLHIHTYIYVYALNEVAMCQKSCFACCLVKISLGTHVNCNWFSITKWMMNKINSC